MIFLLAFIVAGIAYALFQAHDAGIPFFHRLPWGQWLAVVLFIIAICMVIYGVLYG